MDSGNILFAVIFAIICFQEVKALPLKAEKKNEKASLMADVPSDKSISEKPSARDGRLNLSPDVLDSAAAMKDHKAGISTLTKPSRPHRRYRRSFGTKSICIPKQKKNCTPFTYGGISKNFCVKYTEIICTALD